MDVHSFQILGISLLASHGIYITDVGANTVSIRCSSVKYQYKSCPILGAQGGGRVVDVTVANRLSSAACSNGNDYGHSVTAVWVNNGCRAEFRVEYEEAPSSTSTVQPLPETTERVDIVPQSTQFTEPDLTSDRAIETTAETTQRPGLELSSREIVDSTALRTNISSSTIHPFTTSTQQNVFVTTTAIVSVSHPVWTCLCRCAKNTIVTYQQDVIQALRLEKKRMSRHVRQMTSAEDLRLSSAGIGVLAILILLGSMAVLMTSNVVTWCSKVMKSKVHTTKTIGTA